MSVWLQIQEELRWIESPTPAQVEELLGRYNPLIARPGQLCASLFLDSSDPVALTRYALGFTASRLNLRLLLHGRLMAARSLERQAAGLDAVTYLRLRACVGRIRIETRSTGPIQRVGRCVCPSRLGSP